MFRVVSFSHCVYKIVQTVVHNKYTQHYRYAVLLFPFIGIPCISVDCSAGWYSGICCHCPSAEESLYDRPGTRRTVSCR